MAHNTANRDAGGESDSLFHLLAFEYVATFPDGARVSEERAGERKARDSLDDQIISDGADIHDLCPGLALANDSSDGL